MTQFKMFAAGVDNGSHLDMRIRTLDNVAWQNNFDTDQEPGKDIGSTWNIRTPSFRYNGYEAPVVSVTGIIDTTENSLGSSPGGSIFVTLARLGSLSRIGSVYILYPALSDFFGSPFTNYFTGSVYSVINSTRWNMNNSYIKGSEYVVNYNMQLTLVSGPV